MAEAQPKVQLPDQMSQLTQLLNVFKGFTTAGQKQTATADPGALAALSQIASSFTRENAMTDANGLIEAAMQAAAKEFAPVLGKERAAGMYNVGSTGKLANDVAVAKAGEMARTILAAASQYGAVGANAAGNLAQSTRVVNSRPQSRIDPAGILSQAGGLGLMMLLKRMLGDGKANAAGTAGKAAAGTVLDKLFDTDAGNEVSRNITSLFGSGEATAAGDIINNTSAIDFGFPAATDYSLALNDAFSGLSGFGGDLLGDSFLPALDIAGGFGDFATDAASSILDFGATDFGIDYGIDAGLDFGLDYGAEFAVDAAGSAAIEGAADAGLGFGMPYYTVFKAAGDIFDINEIQDVTGAISKGINSAFDAVSIVCTALHIHGDMSRRLYLQSGLDFRRYAKEHDVRGYYALAARYLKLMARSPVAYQFAKHVFTVRAEHAYAKNRGAKSTILGWLYYHLLYRINDVASLALRLKRRIYG